MKEFWKSVKIWQSYRHEFGGPVFLEHSVCDIAEVWALRKARYTLPVSMDRVHGPWTTWPMNTGVDHFGRPCPRAVDTRCGHGRWTRVSENDIYVQQQFWLY